MALGTERKTGEASLPITLNGPLEKFVLSLPYNSGSAGLEVLDARGVHFCQGAIARVH